MPQTLWISHRGYKRDAVENTAEAFRAAVRGGFTALETDLRLSADGHIVLHHDPTLVRLAGDRREVGRLTRQQLSELRLGPQRAQLLFLDEFLDEFPALSWVFDIKPETGEGVIRALHALGKERGWLDLLIAQTKFVTWSKRHEQILAQLFPGVKVYANERECWRAGLALVINFPSLAGLRPDRTYALPPRLGRVQLYTPQIVGTFHQAKAKVVAFLPETEDEVAAACRVGIDEILTNGLIRKP